MEIKLLFQLKEDTEEEDTTENPVLIRVNDEHRFALNFL
jgi:hypothetical protein